MKLTRAVFFSVFLVPLLGVAEVETPVQTDQAPEAVRLLRRAQDAMGGAKSLSSVRDTTHVMDITLEPAAGGYTFRQISRYVSPNHLRQEQQTPFGRIVVYSDGETGWIATPQGIMPLSTDLLATVQGVLFRQPTALMLSDRDSSRSVQSVGESAIVVLSAEGQRVEIEFSTDSGLPSRYSYLASPTIGSADGNRYPNGDVSRLARSWWRVVPVQDRPV